VAPDLVGGPTPTLRDVVERLTRLYGNTGEPYSSDPFELILWENVAYLANDERRTRAMAQLRQTVGTRPALLPWNGSC
jgi:hypothetical protein